MHEVCVCCKTSCCRAKVVSASSSTLLTHGVWALSELLFHDLRGRAQLVTKCSNNRARERERTQNLFRIMSCNKFNLKLCTICQVDTMCIEGERRGKKVSTRWTLSESRRGGGARRCVRLCAINIMHNNYFIVKTSFHDLVARLCALR